MQQTREKIQEIPDCPRTVLITGATRGIGRAITEAFLSAGDQVVGIYHTSTVTAKELEAAYTGFTALQCDLSITETIGDTLSRLPPELQAIDILVNNAGIKLRGDFFDTSLDTLSETMRVNLYAPFEICRIVGAGMRSRKDGRIINITSQATANLTPDSIEYGTSKAGLVHFTKALAKLLAPDGVTVNGISPGRTYTDLTGYNHDPAKEAAAIRGIPMHHINSPSEVAGLAVFLASDAAANMTGQIIAIDGGEVIR
jgi:NAD(P)-dependent dehydrogenase (short-subunit alcohol dehydrogenase family)